MQQIDDSNKQQLIREYVNTMLAIAEQQLDAIGRRYAGLGPNRRGQFKDALAKELEKNAVYVPPVVPPTPSPTPAVSPTLTHVPVDVVPQLNLLGFGTEQADTILSLISLPENSSTEWWKQYNYAEWLGDGRGLTATLFGACSGTGGLLMIVQELQKINSKHKLVKYVPALKKAKGEDRSGLEHLAEDIHSIGNDKEWQAAVWRVYINLYWNFARNFSDKFINRPGAKLTSPLTRGFMVDTSLNHGANLESFAPILNKMKNKNETDEATWFLDFVEARRQLLKSGFQDLDTSKTGDRCTLWADLFKQGNTLLDRPIKAYRGYWGDQTIN